METCNTNLPHSTLRLVVTAPEENATALLQAALDKVFLAGGGTVELEKGVYHIGAVRVRSNTTLYLRAGAILKGSRVPEDYDILEYDRLEPLRGDDLKKVEFTKCQTVQTEDGWLSGPCSRWNHGLIRVFEAENVSILGQEGAVIDGSDCYDALGEEGYRGPHGISLMRSKNIVCRGYTVQNTGNWAHIATSCQDLTFAEITVLAGHDGIHVQNCDDVHIENCGFYTGDDCVAGIDNNRVTVKNCVMNTACNAFRFGGTDVLIEQCSMYGPGKYVFRGKLSLEDKINGVASPGASRKNMLSVFTYFADFTFPIRNPPGNIVFRNCRCQTIDRFINYDFSGRSRWQCNRPLASVSFENIEARDIRVPLFLYGDEKEPVSVSLTDVRIDFTEAVDACFYTCNCKELRLQRVTVTGAEHLVKSWGNTQPPVCEAVSGPKLQVIPTNDPWRFSTI